MVRNRKVMATYEDGVEVIDFAPPRKPCSLPAAGEEVRGEGVASIKSKQLIVKLKVNMAKALSAEKRKRGDGGEDFGSVSQDIERNVNIEDAAPPAKHRRSR